MAATVGTPSRSILAKILCPRVRALAVTGVAIFYSSLMSAPAIKSRLSLAKNDGLGLALGKFIQNDFEPLHLPEPESLTFESGSSNSTHATPSASNSIRGIP